MAVAVGVPPVSRAEPVCFSVPVSAAPAASGSDPAEPVAPSGARSAVESPSPAVTPWGAGVGPVPAAPGCGSSAGSVWLVIVHSLRCRAVPVARTPGRGAPTVSTGSSRAAQAPTRPGATIRTVAAATPEGVAPARHLTRPPSARRSRGGRAGPRPRARRRCPRAASSATRPPRRRARSTRALAGGAAAP
ncbi:Uncharacterised protein [Mycobacteroides abscessus]|nr:Uncharacterised protein [Mycobacteroides abscessus]